MAIFFSFFLLNYKDVEDVPMKTFFFSMKIRVSSHYIFLEWERDNREEEDEDKRTFHRRF